MTCTSMGFGCRTREEEKKEELRQQRNKKTLPENLSAEIKWKRIVSFKCFPEFSYKTLITCIRGRNTLKRF